MAARPVPGTVPRTVISIISVDMMPATRMAPALAAPAVQVKRHGLGLWPGPGAGPEAAVEIVIAEHSAMTISTAASGPHSAMTISTAATGPGRARGPSCDVKLNRAGLNSR